MKKYLSICFLLLCFLSKAQLTTLTPGEVAPEIKLPDIYGKVVTFNNYPSAKGFIVIFTCNTCPYSKAYEQRMVKLNDKYSPLGFPVIAVNPNDPEASPGDSFSEMKDHAKSSGFTFPYLYDEGQIVTKSYGPKSTPHVFLINKTSQGNLIEYTGAIDNDTQNINPDKTNYLEDAITALINGKKPATTVTKAIGCRVKLKNKEG